MRWGALQVDRSENDAQAALFGRDEVVARTFETPEFAGMTFYEVQARSIINRVPAASRMFFDWTVNPYRGCGHACVYCLDRATPVLLADGTERAIADLEPGDAIVGTVPGAARRHYVITHVLARWETEKPAYRVGLSDGRELVASADHRFLTDQGWAYVLAGDDGRRALGTGSVLIGSGVRPGVPSQEFVGHQIPPDTGVIVTRIEELGETRPMVDITTGTGDFIADGVVSHNCFARGTHTYLDLDTGLDFDRKIVVKVNAAERLRRELAKSSWSGEHIAMGTNVDCYQRAEGRYRLMPGIIRALTQWRNPFSILTKGTLILRDLDLLVEAAAATDVSLNLSIGLTDSDLWRSVEPGTPGPKARLGAVRTLSEHGFEVGVLMAPILPYLSDRPDQLRATVTAIVEAGAARVTPLVLHLRPGAREWYFAWLETHHPDLVRPYRELYAAGAYAPKHYQEKIGAMVSEFSRKAGVRTAYGRGLQPTRRDATGRG